MILLSMLLRRCLAMYRMMARRRTSGHVASFSMLFSQEVRRNKLKLNIFFLTYLLELPFQDANQDALLKKVKNGWYPIPEDFPASAKGTVAI